MHAHARRADDGSVSLTLRPHRHRLTKPEYTVTWHRNDEFIEGHENGTHVTDLLAKQALEFLQKERNQPFFLYLPFHAPHTPLVEPQEWLDKVAHIEDPDRRLFLAAVAHVDDAIGQVINAVDNSVALENTIVIFTSDNGGIHNRYKGNTYPPPDPPLNPGFSSNHPLRGQKGQAYEGGIRVPAFIIWVGKLDPATVNQRNARRGLVADTREPARIQARTRDELGRAGHLAPVGWLGQVN